MRYQIVILVHHQKLNTRDFFRLLLLSLLMKSFDLKYCPTNQFYNFSN